MIIVESSPVLQSKTRVGKEKFWQGHVCKSNDRWYTQTSYWQTNKDGSQSAVQWSEPYESTPKNVGKANETSAKEQAFLEYESMVTKQRDKGYTEPGTKSTVLPLPMLAQKFTERGHKIQWPAYVQPKYNGQRMLFDGKKGWSRGGKEILPSVIKHLQCNTQGRILDGELILPGNLLLQKTMEATKKYTPGVSETLLYIVYDVVDETKPFSERFEILKGIVWSIGNQTRHIVLAPTKKIDASDKVKEHHAEFIKEGFEGTMIRDDSEGYHIGYRSNQLQKYKDFVDAEFKIVDVNEGDGKFKGAAIFRCDNGHGQLFDCTPEGTMKIRRQYYTDKQNLIGKYLTIRYQELSKDKIPLFPVGVGVREIGDF